MTSILRTHNLKSLRKFIIENSIDLSIDWSKTLGVDGYYFSTRYPGEDAMMVGPIDIDDAWAAVKETRRATIDYIERHKPNIRRSALDAVNEICTKQVNK